MDVTRDLLLELDQLKAVYRKSYLSDQSRYENSAEHSWHLVVSFIANICPEIHLWMIQQLEQAIEDGWVGDVEN